MIDDWDIQFGLVYDCMRACIYANYICLQKPNKKGAWIGIMDICYADAVVTWNQLFGTRSQETHWSKFTCRIQIPKDEVLKPFNKHLISEYLNISIDQWAAFHRSMVDCRNIRVAHFNIDQKIIKLPNLTFVLGSVKLYRTWLVEALRMGKRLGHEIKVTDKSTDDAVKEFDSLIKKAYYSQHG